MDKSLKMKKAARNNRMHNFKQCIKKVVMFPWNLCKAVWRFIVRICKTLWNWLKSIDIVGMVNLTLLVAIIVLFTGLILDISKDKPSIFYNSAYAELNARDNRKVVQRKPNLKANSQSNVQITNASFKKVPASIKNKTTQKLYGDIIVDNYPSTAILSNGVQIDGNLFIQNMRKYTLPCNTKIRGNMFIRNVGQLNFCGDFKIMGNIYVTPESSFGPIPHGARISGQVIL